MPSYKTERKIGLVLSTILVIVALWPLINDNAVNPIWISFAISLLSITLFLPKLLQSLVKVWMKLGHLLGVINTYLILIFVFYIFITPLALFFRLIGRDALQMKLKNKKTYWLKQKKSWPTNSFKNQF